MILTADYHTHTPYSHGENTIAENVEQAVKLGLKEIAISDHGFTHLAYGIRRKEVDSFMAECREAEARFGIRVLRGIEGNVGGIFGNCDLTEKDYENFDVYLCGYHLTTIYKHFGDFFFNGLGNICSNRFKIPASKTLVQRNTRICRNDQKSSY